MDLEWLSILFGFCGFLMMTYDMFALRELDSIQGELSDVYLRMSLNDSVVHFGTAAIVSSLIETLSIKSRARDQRDTEELSSQQRLVVETANKQISDVAAEQAKPKEMLQLQKDRKQSLEEYTALCQKAERYRTRFVFVAVAGTSALLIGSLMQAVHKFLA